MPVPNREPEEEEAEEGEKERPFDYFGGLARLVTNEDSMSSIRIEEPVVLPFRDHLERM